MSKVITFSRVFPRYHPKAGQPTFFVEKLVKGGIEADPEIFIEDLEAEFYNLMTIESFNRIIPKFHTIRSGHRWKAGDKFSPRVWSGKPYHSKQIIIAPDIEIVKVWDIVIRFRQTSPTIYINGKTTRYTEGILSKLAGNDGLTSPDFISWFLPYWEFDGQIICWSDKVEY